MPQYIRSVYFTPNCSQAFGFYSLETVRQNASLEVCLIEINHNSLLLMEMLTPDLTGMPEDVLEKKVLFKNHALYTKRLEQGN